MRVRAIDGVGDWTFGAGANNYKKNLKAVEQNVQTRLSSFLGDCFFDLGAGLDWFNFLGGSKDQTALNLAISSVILNTDFVVSVAQLSIVLNPINRHFTISYQVNTSFGMTSNVVVLPTSYLLTQDGDPLVTQDGENIIT